MSTTAGKLVKRLAADLLKVGTSRVRIDPSATEKVETAITREDVRRLIKEGLVYEAPPSTPSRGRWRIVREQRKRGRRRGPGSRKGPRVDEKRLWIARVRAQRRFLKTLRLKGVISAADYRRLRGLVKGGMFSSVRHLKMYLEEHGLLRRPEVAGGGEKR